MLREPHERPSPFGRRDAVRLVLAAVLIVAALAAGVISDLTPSSPNLAAGTIAQSAVVAPRDATIPNAIKTKQAQDAASAAQTPVYDYTPDRAKSIAATSGGRVAARPQAGRRRLQFVDGSGSQNRGAADGSALAVVGQSDRSS